MGLRSTASLNWYYTSKTVADNKLHSRRYLCSWLAWNVAWRRDLRSLSSLACDLITRRCCTRCNDDICCQLVKYVNATSTISRQVRRLVYNHRLISEPTPSIKQSAAVKNSHFGITVCGTVGLYCASFSTAMLLCLYGCRSITLVTMSKWLNISLKFVTVW